MSSLNALVGCTPLRAGHPKQDIDFLRERAAYCESLFDDDPDPLAVDREHYKRLWSKANWRQRKEKRQAEIADLRVQAAAYLKRQGGIMSSRAIANRLKCCETLLKHALHSSPYVKLVRRWIGGKLVTRWRAR